MKKNKRKLSFILIACLPFFAISQVLEPENKTPDDIINGAYSKDHNKDKEEAYEYPEIKEKDIVWSRTIWREIDLRQKINHHFYYPDIKNPEDLNPENMSLIDVVMEAFQDTTKMFRVFNVIEGGKPGNEFKYGEKTNKEKLSIEVETKEGQIIESRSYGGGDSIDVNGEVVRKEDVIIPFDRRQVKKWLVKEEWFFDKHRSGMSVRITGLCPVATVLVEVEEEDEFSVTDTSYYRETKLFWIYFPEFRDVFVKTKVSNFTKNNAQQRSYLGVFEKRMFGSRVLQESNIMNRGVTDYMVGLDALLESDRIKEEIFNIEQDMWEY